MEDFSAKSKNTCLLLSTCLKILTTLYCSSVLPYTSLNFESYLFSFSSRHVRIWSSSSIVFSSLQILQVNWLAHWCPKFILQSSIFVLTLNNIWTSSVLNLLSEKYGCFSSYCEGWPYHEDISLHSCTLFY